MSEKEWLSAEEQERIVAYYQERFGLPLELFSGRKMYQGSRQRVYLVSESLVKCSVDVVSGVNVARLGAAIKPTTDFLQLQSASITRNILVLETEQAKSFIAGEELDLPEALLGEFTNGYLCVKYSGQALGCAHVKNGVLRNLLSKDRRRKLEYL